MSAAHDEHTTLDGYDPNQILHDGCAVCEQRGARVDDAIANLDSVRFAEAWMRAAQLQLHGVPNVSEAELPLLRALAMVQVQLERRGLPIGTMPL